MLLRGQNALRVRSGLASPSGVCMQSPLPFFGTRTSISSPPAPGAMQASFTLGMQISQVVHPRLNQSPRRMQRRWYRSHSCSIHVSKVHPGTWRKYTSQTFSDLPGQDHIQMGRKGKEDKAPYGGQVRTARDDEGSVSASASQQKVPLNAFSLYFHYPYCNKLCGYCNFNKFLKGRKENPSDMELLDAYISSVESIKNSEYARQWAQRGTPLELRSVFFGGGTPSLGDPEMYRQLISYIKESFPVASSVSSASPISTERIKAGIPPTSQDDVSQLTELEISLEMNPTLATPKTLEALRRAGVNRVSIGVQSLKDEDLKFLGREHSSKQAIQILEEAMNLYEGRVSADLMFGMPSHHHALDNFKYGSLLPLLNLGLQHISLYELTIEKGTLFHKLYRLDETEKMDEDVLASLYEVCIEECAKHGLYQYEVSNFAASMDHECKHNISYWQGIDYIGIGPGAHSRITDITSNTRYELVQFAKPEDWRYECIFGSSDSHRRERLEQREGSSVINDTQSKRNHLVGWGGTSKISEISAEQRLQEIVMVALRMPQVGLSASTLQYHTNDSNAAFLDGKYLNKQGLEILLREGLLRIVTQNDEQHLQATESGIRVLNGIINELV